MMEGLWLKQVLSTAVPWAFAFLVGGLLLRENRKNRNPLEWILVDRSLLVAALYFFAGGVSSFVYGFAILQADPLSFINWSTMPLYYTLVRATGMVWVVLVVIGIWVRGRAPESRVFTHVVLQYSALSIAGACYMYGPVTHPGPVLLSMALGTMNFLLLGPSFAVPWLVTFSLIIVASTVATLTGLLPYAPFYTSTPFQDGVIDPFYLVATEAFVLLLFWVMLVLTAYIFVRWRDRETKFSDMSALLKKMFGRYLSTEVMNAILKDPASLELGGERRKVTIMMTDLRGFTALSERLEPEKVVQMLNAYFEVMVDIVLKYHGTINEFIGDALLVIFGAPNEMEDRNAQAIACSIDMQIAMTEVNRQNRRNGLPELEMGIGLNEAEVIVGNIGSSKRSKYAVVGSGVNMASRIESYTVGGQVLVSESVKREAADILRIDDRMDVLPKGAQAPISIYDVGGIGGPYNLALDETKPDYAVLSKGVPLHYAVLEGKDVGKKGLRGSILRLSKKGADIDLQGPVDVLTNLKLSLTDVDEELAQKDFYGKVIAPLNNGQPIYTVRFTAVPPEVSAYFKALLKYAIKPVL
ncbi:adenylate/guanylate cyclase domain-containing protein [Thermodesulfobacteriota bacterium]